MKRWNNLQLEFAITGALKIRSTMSEMWPGVEDASRVRVGELPAIFAIARNLALNLYREAGETNMAQAQRLAGYGLDVLKKLFRMK